MILLYLRENKISEQYFRMDSNEKQEIACAEDEEIEKIAKDILNKHIDAFKALANLENVDFEE